MLTIEYAKNPKFNSEDKKQIYLVVKFAEFDEELPFNATSFDSMPYGVELYERALSGEFGEVAAFVPPAPNAQMQPISQGAQTL